MEEGGLLLLCHLLEDYSVEDPRCEAVTALVGGWVRSFAESHVSLKAVSEFFEQAVS